MPDVFIVRHGHSPMQAQSDHQRELSLEGRLAAQKAAAFIRSRLNQPCVCICSDAVRTYQTANILCEALQLQPPAPQSRLYNATVGLWHEVILANPDASQILVGHNPTMSQLYTQLSGQHRHFAPACVGLTRIEIQPDGLTLPVSEFEFYNPNQ